MPLDSGTEVAVLTNGLGATPLMELYILHRTVARVLGERDIRIHRSYVGEYVTSLEMAGASISVLKLDAELKQVGSTLPRVLPVSCNDEWLHWKSLCSYI